MMLELIMAIALVLAPFFVHLEMLFVFFHCELRREHRLRYM